MNKGKIGAVISGIALILIFISLIICIEKIPVGYEGVVYSMNGGVKDETLQQGWHMVAPTKKVKEFTISNEQLILTKDSRKDSEDDESFRVATSDNASIAISFQMSYRFISGNVIDTYKKFRGMDGEAIVNNRVKTVLKSTVSEVTTDYSLMDLYSGNRSEINSRITEYLNDKFSKQYGIEVIDASIIDVHPDEQLMNAINNRVEAQQRADQARADQETAKVEAETALIKAQNEAAIQITKADAEAQSNERLAASITPELIAMKEAEARLVHGWITVQGANNVVTKEGD